MTETDMIYGLHYFLMRTKSSSNHIPNSFLYGWEADMLELMQSGYVHEYEVKISRSDFLQDTKKKKFEIMTGVCGANYFTYVAPMGVILLEEIPDYAGLIVLNEKRFILEKKAQLRHERKISPEQEHKLLYSMIPRYWKLRKNTRTPSEEEMIRIV